MDVKGEVLLQLFNKSKLKNGTKTLLEPFFLFIVKFKKLGFSAPLSVLFLGFGFSIGSFWKFFCRRPCLPPAVNKN